eukprot:GDKH01021353.1.p3 GENE.GDKH01021353.1~~GDKH01021353.1.p3  ORF type:complete len:70 (+),score=0.65 GDKH01021353.1:95-304(+)
MDADFKSLSEETKHVFHKWKTNAMLLRSLCFTFDKCSPGPLSGFAGVLSPLCSCDDEANPIPRELLVSF